MVEFSLWDILRNLLLAARWTVALSLIAFIGGGLVGCEEGLDLAQRGHRVTVLEMRENVAIDAAYLHREALLLEIAKHPEAITLLTHMRCKEVTPEGVVAVDEAGTTRFFEADTVMVAAGMRPRSEAVESLRDCAPDFLVIGDGWKPRRVLEAVRSGYDAGMHL